MHGTATSGAACLSGSRTDVPPLRAPAPGGRGNRAVNHDNRSNRARLGAGDGSIKFLPYQLSTLAYWPKVAATGNGGLGLDPGEGA